MPQLRHCECENHHIATPLDDRPGRGKRRVFTLSSLGITWNLGRMQLVSSTSYFDRTDTQWYDYTKGYVEYYVPEFFLAADPIDRAQFRLQHYRDVLERELKT